MAYQDSQDRRYNSPRMTGVATRTFNYAALTATMGTLAAAKIVALPGYEPGKAA
jgi:hypothetical protein